MLQDQQALLKKLTESIQSAPNKVMIEFFCEVKKQLQKVQSILHGLC